MATKRLFRSNEGRMIAGVCEGIGKYFNTDPVIIRAIFVLGLFLWTGAFWVYLILWVIVPAQNPTNKSTKKRTYVEGEEAL